MRATFRKKANKLSSAINQSLYFDVRSKSIQNITFKPQKRKTSNSRLSLQSSFCGHLNTNLSLCYHSLRARWSLLLPRDELWLQNINQSHHGTLCSPLLSLWQSTDWASSPAAHPTNLYWNVNQIRQPEYLFVSLKSTHTEAFTSAVAMMII